LRSEFKREARRESFAVCSKKEAGEKREVVDIHFKPKEQKDAYEIALSLLM